MTTVILPIKLAHSHRRRGALACALACACTFNASGLGDDTGGVDGSATGTGAPTSVATMSSMPTEGTDGSATGATTPRSPPDRPP